MPPRPATIADYRWLYEHTDYMAGTAIKRAAEALPEIMEQMPATLCDVGGGRNEFASWIALNTSAPDVASIDPATSGSSFGCIAPADRFDIVTCFDVLEHLQPHVVEDFIRDELGAHCTSRIYATICQDREIREVNGEPVELHLCREHINWWLCQFDRAMPGWTIRHKQCEQPTRYLIIAEHP